MAQKIIRLKKDMKRLPFSYAGKILIQTNSNLYSNDPLYNEWENCGTVEKGSIIIAAKPISFVDINGVTVTQGYDGSVEFGFNQLYSLFEYEKFVNEKCTISLPDIKMYIPDITLAMELNFKPGDTAAPIKMTGTKIISTYEELLTDNPWPVSGAKRQEPWVNEDNTASIIGSGEGGFYNDATVRFPGSAGSGANGVGTDRI